MKDNLSRSKTFSKNILSLSFSWQICSLPWNFVRNLSENKAILPSIQVIQITFAECKWPTTMLSSKKDHRSCHGADFTKNDTLSWSPIQKMMPYSAAHPYTEAYMSTPLKVFCHHKRFVKSNLPISSVRIKQEEI